MINLVKSGIAATASLSDWNYYNVRIIPDINEGKVFKLSRGAYMAQFSTLEGSLNGLNISIRYMNAETSPVCGEVVVTSDDSTDTSINMYLPCTNGRYIDYVVPIEVQSISLGKFAIELRTDAAQECYITVIEVTGELTTKSDSVNTQDFAKYAIMYGLDANKPRLEVISNAGNIL